jgi:hypothetical protein
MKGLTGFFHPPSLFYFPCGRHSLEGKNTSFYLMLLQQLGQGLFYPEKKYIPTFFQDICFILIGLSLLG